MVWYSFPCLQLTGDDCKSRIQYKKYVPVLRQKVVAQARGPLPLMEEVRGTGVARSADESCLLSEPLAGIWQGLDQVMRSTTDCIKILELDGSLRWMNVSTQELCAIHGFEVNTGCGWMEFWTEADRPAAQLALDAARAGGFGRFEASRSFASGKQRWWDVSVTPLVDGSGRPEALVAISREITDSKQVENELAHTSHQLQIIANRVPALIAYVDREGRYQWVNSRYTDWYRLTPAEIVGRYWYEVIDQTVGPDYVEQLRPNMVLAYAGQAVMFEARHFFGGRHHDLQVIYEPDKDANGQVRGIVLMVINVTERHRREEELVASQEQFRTLTEALPPIVFSTRPDGGIDYLSDRFTEITGRPQEDGLDDRWVAVFHPEDAPHAVDAWLECLRSGARFEKQSRVLQRDGSYRWFAVHALPQRNSAGEVVRWVGAAMDVHQQAMAEEAVRQSERKFRMLFDDNPLPMWTYDIETLRFLTVNDAALATYGYSRKEFLQMKVTEIRPAEDVEKVLAILRAPRLRPSALQVRHQRKNGSVFWVESTGHDVTGSEGKVRLVVAQDVTERVHLNEELLRRAEHDPLTGLPNRSLLADQFEKAVQRPGRRHQRIALLTIDFDRFKEINNTFGYDIGDEFLKAAAERLKSRLRPGDTLSRVGGNEFIALADEMESVEDCFQLVRQLREAFAQPINVMDLQLQPTLSIGLAIYPDDGTQFDDLIRHADFALDQAKRAGRNCWRHYEGSDNTSVDESRQIERSLRHAIEQNRLTLHYQPMFSGTGKLCMVEALVRLSDPHLGVIAPGRFIPIAEESGLIHSIGTWIVREACRQMKQWRDQGVAPLSVAVNVSAMQFARGDFAEEVRSALEEFELEPQLLELELTESLLMENTGQTRRQLEALKAMGVRIAMDDFGTGYSSLSYLHRLPLDSLKVDRSFVQQLGEKAGDAVVAAIVELGKQLGLTVIAEGVETEQQREALLRLGCDLLQGYLLAQPQTAEDVQLLLSAHTL